LLRVVALDVVNGHPQHLVLRDGDDGHQRPPGLAQGSVPNGVGQQ
jgi:hypothetical protein